MFCIHFMQSMAFASYFSQNLNLTLYFRSSPYVTAYSQIISIDFMSLLILVYVFGGCSLCEGEL